MQSHSQTITESQSREVTRSLSHTVTQSYNHKDSQTHIVYIYMSGWFLEIGESKTDGFEPWSNETNEFKIDTYCFPARYSALLGYGQDWLVHCQDNVSEWDIR